MGTFKTEKAHGGCRKVTSTFAFSASELSTHDNHHFYYCHHTCKLQIQILHQSLAPFFALRVPGIVREF